MRKSDFDFQSPTKQHYVAILMMVYKFYKGIVRQLFPFLILWFVGSKSSSYISTIKLAIIVLAIFGTIYGIIAFFKYHFILEDDELVIEKGVFGRKKINIPLERIQTIDFEQNIVHQIFSVVALKIDTAGSAKSEFKFDALDKSVAEELRSIILQRKGNLSSQKKNFDASNELIYEEDEVRETILKLNPLDLLKIGVTENHFRSFALIILFVGWAMQNLDDIGVDVTDYINSENVDSAFVKSFLMVAFGILFFIVVSFLYSLIRTILKYFDLKFLRTKEGFKLISGLFNRREVAARDTKIQIMLWSQNFLQKWLKLFEINLKQASSIQVGNKKSIIVPGSYIEQVEKVKNYLFKNTELKNLNLEGVSFHYFLRNVMYYTILFLLIAVILFAAKNIQWMILLTIIYLWLCFSRYLRYKKKKFAVNSDVLLVHGGIFGSARSLIKLFKVQNIKIKQNMYQRRRGLASLIVYTASGGIKIPYIHLSKAMELSDFLIYNVETSKQKWM